MERKEDPLHIDVKLLSETVNTPGTEIAPRSDVVGEDFQGEWCGHELPP